MELGWNGECQANAIRDVGGVDKPGIGVAGGDPGEGLPNVFGVDEF